MSYRRMESRRSHQHTIGP
uniref:Uncharacterized protein n=1 Tax=Lepeophtheirus salmonis TaxID=72036 RepID=A0A0K2VLD0_LEPSM